MIPINEFLLFALASLIMVLSPGPNMIYLISRSLSQGRQAGIISLFGVICGFLFHILMVSFGLTAIFFAVPYAFMIVKFLGVGYLLYLAYNTIRSGGTKIFDADRSLKKDKPLKLFNIGLLTNVLNPKMALFYLSFFPQFIKPEYGSILGQSFQLGVMQIMISFSINFLIVISAAKMAGWFAKNPLWVRVQKWFMASVLTGLAVKIAFAKAK
ncbi:threonine/homoserine/homoserine lactone efflux protein [Aquimarina sp. EL_43]|uniref:LysE family translocator n=1 Tax=unclassified Aquimarina TaxID=2627091 RepID=UPI0018CAE2A7|nr:MULTISPECIES: LysE family translocator [unclassified Aquimarina]MBG6131414.1 threonine/homoserine/homoserine lactone efflux protein [Aquimarina sp. EL_35]MBG6151703.1 threonine/homoserine/homoserine lactone efflux protein [Aquimarina sp. EL_32]MBG6169633.1 threonine/homoserine/homoserine lactone efflux protein [Aquimarina sp. EL_43]